jgi:hypothetical protein
MNGNKKKIGALWRRVTRNSGTILTGSIDIEGKEEKLRIIIFTNSYKVKGSKQPDFVIYEDTYKPGDRGSAEKAREVEPDDPFTGPPLDEEEPLPDGYDDDSSIPF